MLNQDFVSKYNPATLKDKDEYWMLLDDFRINFGGLIICSSVDPYRPEGFGVHRRNSCHIDSEREAFHKPVSQYGKYLNDRMYKHRNSLIHKSAECTAKRKIESRGEIKVVEDSMTVKLDNTNPARSRGGGPRRHSIDITDRTVVEEDLAHFSFQGEVSCEIETNNIRCNWITSRTKMADVDSKVPHTCDCRMSAASNISDSESYFSTSDISLSIHEQVIGRPRSAPMGHMKRHSSGSLSLLTQTNFLATRTDCFRSHGAWKQIVDFKSSWKSKLGHKIEMNICHMFKLTGYFNTCRIIRLT